MCGAHANVSQKFPITPIDMHTRAGRRWAGMRAIFGRKARSVAPELAGRDTQYRDKLILLLVDPTL